MPKYQPQSPSMGDSSRNEMDGQITLHYPMMSRNNYVEWAIKMKVFMQA